MYLTSDSLVLIQQPFAAGFVLWLKRSFIRIRDGFGLGIAYGIAFILLAAFWVLLWAVNRSLKKQLRRPLVLDDYSRLRIEYDKLNQLFDQDKLLNNKVNRSKAPWFLKGVLKQSRTILRLSQQRRDDIGTLLASLDASAPVTDLLKPTPEKDLWAAKIKVYEYRF